jgi:hypothetical protein
LKIPLIETQALEFPLPDPVADAADAADDEHDRKQTFARSAFRPLTLTIGSRCKIQTLSGSGVHRSARWPNSGNIAPTHSIWMSANDLIEKLVDVGMPKYMSAVNQVRDMSPTNNRKVRVVYPGPTASN